MEEPVESTPIDRRESVRRAAIGALALSLGVPGRLEAVDRPASRFALKFYYGDRLLEGFELNERTAEAMASRPTAMQMKWYDLETDREQPRSTVGFTERFEMKGEIIVRDGSKRG